VSVQTVIGGIKKLHPAIAPLLGKGLGHLVQWHESQILVNVLLRLITKGIVALPVHDCVVVPESAAEEAWHVMLETYAYHTGLTTAVKRESAEEYE
jgi:hypothetical protein